jgi:capsular exopolysaccharide synthesis family protein
VSGEGKTTVAVNLAHAIALTGRKVALVELDLRRPSFASRFKIASKVGFTSLFSGGMAVSDVILTPVPELSNLSVLPAGRIPPNPSELLSSERAAEILSELSRTHDIVIVDAPPLNPVADAQVLLDSPAIQAVLMVARADVVTRDQVQRARAILDFHTVKPVGLVATGVRDVNRYGYEFYTEESASTGPLSPSLNGEGSSRRSGGLTQSSLTN